MNRVRQMESSIQFGSSNAPAMMNETLDPFIPLDNNALKIQMTYRQKSYPPPSPYNRRSTSFQASTISSKIVLGWDKGERVALKKIPFNPGESSDEKGESYWENLTKLPDDNLVKYRSFTLQDDGRYLAMELCQGSMLEYCRGTLENAVAPLIKGIDVMWQITCALDYLFRKKIGHGDLELENVLFVKIDSKPKRLAVKLSGYGYNHLQSGDNVKTDFSKLGCLYISAATKKEHRPNEALTTWHLTEIDIEAKKLAFELINLVTDARNPFTFEAGTLLRHPFFIRYCHFALPRLIKEQANEAIRRGLHDYRNLKKWEKFLGSHPQNFKDLETILFSDHDDVEISLTEASKKTPQLLSQYIWHLSTIPAAIPQGDNQIPRLQIRKPLGEGSFGNVYKCFYTNDAGIRFLAACKKSKQSPDAVKVFESEIATLSKIKHLFVIKYLEVVKMDDKQYILMELCEGSLKEYVHGKLDRIPKDSLDNKIIISQVALGLAYLHSEGIIHKDLKLENILLQRQPHDSNLVLVKIADFGFAKKLNPESLSFSATIHLGTPNYMAPELLASSGRYSANFFSDVYALGITIARIALNGDHPFTNNRDLQTTYMVQGMVPQNLLHLSWDLVDLIVKLLNKVPAKRPTMDLVLCHPYFVLTNDKTKRHFVDQFWAHLNSEKENRDDELEKIFNANNFQKWYETFVNDKKEDEETKETENIIDMFKQISPDCTPESLYCAKRYKQAITEVLKAEYDAKVGNQISQVISNSDPFVQKGANYENQMKQVII
ncbi:ribosomal protein S6 kinase alpha-6-like [Daphnia carinata]|uniref:ribosomal protein S6 kinase alpha-6-like n=1 Tax=Daphnia carinata TaxID=120202 RepID=UPI002868C4A9|nr:ribosomal protein S6 kinase alpha-6-like [Daphnia carinata]